MKEREKQRDADRQARAEQQLGDEEETEPELRVEQAAEQPQPASVARWDEDCALVYAVFFTAVRRAQPPVHSQPAEETNEPTAAAPPTALAAGSDIDDMPIGTSSSTPLIIEAEDGTTVVLVPCNNCGRKFNEAR
jgi:hypothetical protein